MLIVTIYFIISILIIIRFGNGKDIYFKCEICHCRIRSSRTAVYYFGHRIHYVPMFPETMTTSKDKHNRWFAHCIDCYHGL